MLYAGCGFCGAIVPLWCSGQFMPHVPVAVAATPMGPTCSVCGILPPIFTCGFCWNRQFLVLPGAPATAPLAGSSQNWAPVVQAQPGASQHVVMELLKEAAGGFGKEAAEVFFGQQG